MNQSGKAPCYLVFEETRSEALCKVKTFFRDGHSH